MKSVRLLFGLLFAVTIHSEASFFISFWCGPPASETTDERYVEIAEAKSPVAMLPIEGSGTSESNRAILELCARHRLKAIISDYRTMTSPSEAVSMIQLD